MIYIVNNPENLDFERRVCQMVGKDIYGFSFFVEDFVPSAEEELPLEQFKEKIIHIVEKEFEYYDIPFSRCTILVRGRNSKEVKKLCSGLRAKSVLVKSNIKRRCYYLEPYDITVVSDGSEADLTTKAFDFIQKEKIYSPFNFQTSLFGDIVII